MKDKKKLGLILGIVAAVVLIVAVIMTLGKGNGQPNETTPGEPQLTVEEAEKLLDEAFNKTIHDFPGHLIDNLDDQENTNFVVYAEGVKRVTTRHPPFLGSFFILCKNSPDISEHLLLYEISFFQRNQYILQSSSLVVVLLL